jgi:hypothetical protein
MADTEIYMRRIKASHEWDQAYESRSWLPRIPYISFPSEWSIQMTPPFLNAIVRFQVRYLNANVSVYLDGYGMLGYVSIPYWEIHPDEEGDAARYPMEDITELLAAIQRSLDTQNGRFRPTIAEPSTEIPTPDEPVATIEKRHGHRFDNIEV